MEKEKPTKYQATMGVSLEGGEAILTDFQGREYEMNLKRVQLIKTLGEQAAFTFITELLDRAVKDALIMSNLGCGYRNPPVDFETLGVPKR